MTKNSIDVTMDWIRTFNAKRTKIVLTEYKSGKPLKPITL